MEDIPKTWDAYYDFFKEVQKKLRAQGQRHIYGLGLNLGIGGDPHNVFAYFLIAYGGLDIVTKDGKLHLDDPKVKEAAIKALTYPTTAYKEGFIPPGAINWNDADDNNAFHSKTVVMDLDGSISTEVAIIKNQQDYNDIVTMGLPLSNDGKPVPSLTGSFCGLIPKGAKNVAAANRRYPSSRPGPARSRLRPTRLFSPDWEPDLKLSAGPKKWLPIVVHGAVMST
jgi:multiple sugar transport system substrate-binding protein